MQWITKLTTMTGLVCAVGALALWTTQGIPWVPKATGAEPQVGEGDERVLATIEAAGPRPGDVLFRRGRTFLSRAVLVADEGGGFSHVGIVVATPGGLGVVHTLPGPNGATGGTRLETLPDFLAAGRASDAALYRLARRPDGDAGHPSRTAAMAAVRFAELAVPFDDDFDLTSEDRLYCTELVWAAYRRAGLDLAGNRFDSLDTPFAGGDYLLPSRLEASPHLQLIVTTRPGSTGVSNP